MTRTRAQDRGRVAAWWGRWGRELVTAIAVGLSAYAVVVTQAHVDDVANQANRIAQEGRERRDQTCLIFEQKEQRDVDTLRRTYEYLANLSAKELAQSLNRAILAQLPATVREAETPDAPTYCNVPGVGLPEPGPALPKRPQNLPKTTG